MAQAYLTQFYRKWVDYAWSKWIEIHPLSSFCNISFSLSVKTKNPNTISMLQINFSYVINWQKLITVKKFLLLIYCHIYWKGKKVSQQWQLNQYTSSSSFSFFLSTSLSLSLSTLHDTSHTYTPKTYNPLFHLYKRYNDNLLNGIQSLVVHLNVAATSNSYKHICMREYLYRLYAMLLCLLA